MARVKINLTCTCCGKQFEHIHFCTRSSEEASYIEWANDNIIKCPECAAIEKQAKKASAVERYIESFGSELSLPEIKGVSDKQIAYARSLRERFVSEELYRYNINLSRFFEIAERLSLDKLSEKNLEILKTAAAKEGKPLDAWFAGYRAERLKRDAHLVRVEDVEKIETIFSESSAVKIIEALR